MNGKIAWICSANAFEASQNERFPLLVRGVFVRVGIAWFWAALALEGRALEVWREQRAERAETRPWGLSATWSHRIGRLKALLVKQAKVQCSPVPAWSLPNSRRIRGLGLGSMWAVLCPFCREFHTHSPGEGIRTPHCCSERDGKEYALELAGPLPAEHHMTFYLSSRAGWPRLLHQWPQAPLYDPEPVQLLAA
jgi:hypothetical protein